MIEIVTCLVASASLIVCDEPPASPTGVGLYRAAIKESIDPLLPARERVRFLRLAGADSIMDEKEFASETERVRPVRPDDVLRQYYDYWEILLMFDHDANQKIDWFEFSLYRKSLREVLRDKFDHNRNGRFEDEELTSEFGRHLFPDLMKKMLKVRGIGTEQADEPLQIGGLNQYEWELALFDRNRAVQLRTHDANGNGIMDPEEIEAWKAKRLEDFQRLTDRNRDGTIDESEKEWYRRSPHFQLLEAEKKYDKNGDGLIHPDELGIVKISEEEAYEQIREWSSGLNEWLRKNPKNWDLNGDGRYDQQESYLMIEAYSKEHPKPLFMRGRTENEEP